MYEHLLVSYSSMYIQIDIAILIFMPGNKLHSVINRTDLHAKYSRKAYNRLCIDKNYPNR
jgi:hypothetical protein